jgi:hypothetical protein
VIGDTLRIVDTDTVPAIDGTYTVNTIVDSDTFTILHTDLTSSGSAGYSGSVLTYDHNKDVGIQVNFNTGAVIGSTSYRTGFFGYKNDLDRMVYYHDATIVNNVVVSGNFGDLQVAKVYGTDAIINTVDITPSLGDISRERSASILNNITTPTNVSNFSFLNSRVRVFDAVVSVEIFGTVTNLYAYYNIKGVQKGTGVWVINTTHVGDIVGVTFSISNVSSSGQIQYTSKNKTDFTSGLVKFRALTTSV